MGSTLAQKRAPWDGTTRLGSAGNDKDDLLEVAQFKENTGGSGQGSL